MTEINSDVIVACAQLVDRAGGKAFEIGYLNEEPPIQWWASARFQGARIMEEGYHSPDAAAMALAQQLLDGAMCRCGQMVTIGEGSSGCRWRLMGEEWKPGCDAPPIKPEKGTKRGDLEALRKAWAERQKEIEGDK